MSRLAEVIDRLTATLEARRGADPSVSWTAKLIAHCRAPKSSLFTPPRIFLARALASAAFP